MTGFPDKGDPGDGDGDGDDDGIGMNLKRGPMIQKNLLLKAPQKKRTLWIPVLCNIVGWIPFQQCQ